MESEILQKEDLQEKETEKGNYLYLYGIINNDDIKLDVQGLKNNPIKKIDFDDISALVSSYPILHPAVEEQETMQHAEILKKIAQKTAVIPTSFGTVFFDEEKLGYVLSVSYKAVKETLKLIANKIELGVKVVKAQINEVPNGVSEEILESLNEISMKNVKGDNFTDRLLLNYSFLVEKNNFTKFSDKIASLEKKHRDLKFLYTGPWPPYSFVNISITGK